MTGENVTAHESVEPAATVSTKAVADQLIDDPVHRAQAEGLQYRPRPIEGLIARTGLHLQPP